MLLFSSILYRGLLVDEQLCQEVVGLIPRPHHITIGHIRPQHLHYGREQAVLDDGVVFGQDEEADVLLHHEVDGGTEGAEVVDVGRVGVDGVGQGEGLWVVVIKTLTGWVVYNYNTSKSNLLLSPSAVLQCWKYPVLVRSPKSSNIGPG